MEKSKHRTKETSKQSVAATKRIDMYCEKIGATA